MAMDPFSVVETHTEGEYFDVVIGDTNFASCDNMYVKQRQFREDYREQIHRLLQEPRAQREKNTVFLLNSFQTGDKRTLLFMRDEEFVPISISGIISMVNVLTRFPSSSRPRPARPAGQHFFKTLAGEIRADVTIESEPNENPRCDSVTVHNVPSFALKLNYMFNVPGLGDVKADIAYGGVMCAFVDAASVGVIVTNKQFSRLMEIGGRIKRYIRTQYTPVHPLDPMICGVSTVVFTQSIPQASWQREILSVAYVTPGRLDRSPSGTVTSAQLAVLYARGAIGHEVLVSRSLTETGYCGCIIGETTVGKYRAILPIIRGQAWVTGIKHVAEPSPFTGGTYGAHQWGQASQTGMDVDDMENIGDLWLPPRPQQQPQQRSQLETGQRPREEPQEHQHESGENQQDLLEQNQEEPQRRPQRGAEYDKYRIPQYQQIRWLMPWDDRGECKCWICIMYEIWDLSLTYGLFIILGSTWLLHVCIQHAPDLFCLALEAVAWGLDWILVFPQSLF